MARWIEDMLTLLAAGGLSTGKLYHTHVPGHGSPNEVVVCIPTAGLGRLDTHSSGGTRRPSFQVYCRSTDGAVAEANADLAYAALHTYNIQVGSNFYQGIEPQDEPTDIGPDDNEREVWGFNVQVWRSG